MKISFLGLIQVYMNGSVHQFESNVPFSYLSRQLTTHNIDINQLMTIEASNDEADLVADRNLTTGEIIGLQEVTFPKRQ